MKRSTVWVLGMIAGGCQAKSPTVAPLEEIPATLTAETPPPATVPLFLVEQHVMTSVPSGFDPTGRFRVDESCMAWDARGDFRGELSEEECASWVDDTLSPNGQARVSTDGPAVVVETEGAPPRRFECSSCAPVRAHGFGPSGDRLALWREGADHIEVWSNPGGERIHDVPLGLAVAPLAVEIGWSDRLWVLANVEPVQDCEDDEVCAEYEYESVRFELLQFQDLETPPVVDRISGSGLALTLDPRGQCLYVMEWDEMSRVSEDTRFSGRALSGQCPEFPESESSEETIPYGEEYWWLTSGPGVQHLWVNSFVEEDDTDLAYFEYDVRVLEFSTDGAALWQERTPSLARVPSAKFIERSIIDVAGVGGDTSLVWRTCSADRDDETGETGTCRVSLDLPAGCEFHDLSPDGTQVAAVCEPSGALMLLHDPPVELDGSGDAEILWGSKSLATVSATAGVVWRPLDDPQTSRLLGPHSAWVDAVFGSVHNRLLLHEDGELRVVDLATGQAVGRVPVPLAAIKAAAWSTSGQRLAMSDGAVVTTLDLPTGKLMATWEAPGTVKLAWRQDDRVLFSGLSPDSPTSAWDPGTGTSVPNAVSSIGDGDLDPTWRFSVTAQNRVLRVLDGLEIWVDEGGVMLDDGRYEGTPATQGSIKIRAGEDMLNAPMFSPHELASVFERPGLADAFFSGKVIDSAPAVITVEQRDAALAKRAVAERVVQRRSPGD